MWYMHRSESTTIFAQMTSYGVITNDVIHFEVIYYSFPVNLNTLGLVELTALDWFDFSCCFSFGEKYKSATKRPTGLLVTARSRLSPTISRLLATNAPQKLTAGRPFWCPYRNVGS